MYIYIYIYIHIPPLREDLNTVYGLRFSTEIYGSKQEKTVCHEYLQEACAALAEIFERDMYTCVFMYIHMYTYTYVYAYVCIYIYIYII